MNSRLICPELCIFSAICYNSDDTTRLFLMCWKSNDLSTSEKSGKTSLESVCKSSVYLAFRENMLDNSLPSNPKWKHHEYNL